MRRVPFLSLAFLYFLPAISPAKELPKIAVWVLISGNITPSYAGFSNQPIAEAELLGPAKGTDCISALEIPKKGSFSFKSFLGESRA